MHYLNAFMKRPENNFKLTDDRWKFNIRTS